MNRSVDNGSNRGADDLTSQSHDEFLELCALSTTGELTAEESKRLEEHLSSCHACREMRHEYHHVVTTIIPSLRSNNQIDEEDSSSSIWSIEQAEATLMKSLETHSRPAGAFIISRQSQVLHYAAALLLFSVLIFASYQIGIRRGHRSAPVVAQAIQSPPLAGSLSAAPAAQPTSHNETTPAKDGTMYLIRERQSELTEIAKLKEQKEQLERELAARKADFERISADRSNMNQQLIETQSDAQALKEKLDAITSKMAHDGSQANGLQTRVSELTSALQEKDRKIAEDQELLRHDRDIRNLIGARDLYIAEIHDVAKTGDTQKPFGRVFYTKDKSLIFYGYDLDQQPGIKNVGTFQAWGRLGAGHQRDVSLGILYLDDSGKKRWVLKFNDATTLTQLDAVFVTIEPSGGSSKPTGKPLLFTYLRLDPNHP